MPLISVVCAVHNRDKYLPQTIESVLNQAFQDWELILWDDASTDKSWEIIRDYALKDCRIKRAFSDSRKGLAYSLHNAIAQSSAEWIAIVDSDDWLEPHALQMMADLSATLKSDFLYSDRWLVDAGGHRIAIEYTPNPEQCLRDCLGGVIPNHLFFFRRRLYQDCGGCDLSLHSAVSFDLCLKLLEKTIPHRLPEPLYNYRLHPDRISTERDQQCLSALKAVRNAIDRRGLPLNARLLWTLEAQPVMPTANNDINAATTGNLT